MSFPSITPQDLKQRLQQKPATKIIDVRTPVEFREVHLVQAENIPLDRCTSEQLKGKFSSADPIYVVCQSGTRAKQACQTLAMAGIPVILVEGGTRACIDAGLEVVRGKKAVSLERQVRMVAGSLVLIGCALAWWVHPYFLGLSAFIGAGLLFAGITDTCGMGMILARMPWNQVKEQTCTTKLASV
jgi:rhodanese-related sulfurtransferase